MNRGRRLASIVVIAALGLGGLAGCRVENGKAAFVGDTTITEKQVDEVYDEVVAAAATGTATPTPEASPGTAELPVTRQEVVDLMVSLELGRRIVIDKKLPAPQEPTDPAQIAEALRAPADSAYVKLWAAWLDVSNVIAENTPRTELTDEGIMKVYGALAKTGAIQAGLTVTQVREAFGSAIFAEAAILVSTALGAEVERTNASVNPRYEPVGAPMAVSTQQGPIFYNLPFISSDMVTDVSL
ncbi:hypothetical protein [Phytohabitans rumicis]|uniref:Lipoprotein n=1 Tax=Phytohabitans rumicis TaxID=1076125 RepID=A0A6V8L256_9ACTN|nr:hypothetical protein [Phytohabitans rumicis]GFJ89640.1 hypothetical protein Prum_032820 [Phytohabitans rumicis]